MTNQDFWDCIKYYEHKNASGDELICDIMVKNGLGQTTGGYFDEARRPEWNIKIERESANPSQEYHFREYYIENHKTNHIKNGVPSYYRLFCPQLLMYIAEVAGLPKKLLLDAYQYLRSYEERNHLIYSPKNARYLPADVLKEYKRLLCIRQITDSIKQQQPGDIEALVSYVSKMKPSE